MRVFSSPLCKATLGNSRQLAASSHGRSNVGVKCGLGHWVGRAPPVPGSQGEGIPWENQTFFDLDLITGLSYSKSITIHRSKASESITVPVEH